MACILAEFGFFLSVEDDKRTEREYLSVFESIYLEHEPLHVEYECMLVDGSTGLQGRPCHQHHRRLQDPTKANNIYSTDRTELSTPSALSVEFSCRAGPRLPDSRTAIPRQPGSNSPGPVRPAIFLYQGNCKYLFIIREGVKS